MAGMKKRYIFDALLTALLVFEMFFQLTGDLLHEVVGLLFFVSIVIHLVLSRKWMKATASQVKRKSEGAHGLKDANAARLAIAIMLAVCMVALMASSLVISNVLMSLTGANIAGAAYAEWSIVHTASSYALCAVVAIHLAVHWASVASVFKIPYDRERRKAIGAGVKIVAGVGAVALGLAGTDKARAAVEQIAGSEQYGNSGQAPSSEGPARDAYGKQGGKHRQGEGVSQFERGANGENSFQPAQGTQNGSGFQSEQLKQRDSEGISEGGSSSSADGICTLCHERCSLSAPRCNRPYSAGLI